MVNCNYIGGVDNEEFNRFLEIINEKYNPGKECLIKIQDRVELAYNKYLLSFSSMEEQDFSEFSYLEIDERKHLRNCYDSETISFQLIRGKIFNSQSDQIKATCPYCLLDKPKTLDHYLGKTEFPEYSILIRNLIPCCYDCNQKKGEKWRGNKKRRYIHFYNDTFLNNRFLYADLVFENPQDIPKIQFYLSKPEALCEGDFNIIKWHFEDLRLFEDYIDKSNSTLSSEIEIIKTSFERGDSIESIRTAVNDRYINIKGFGNNYWLKCMYETIYNNIDQLILIN